MNWPAFHSPILTTVLTAVAPLIWGTTYLVTTEFLPPGLPLTTAAFRTLPAGLLLVLMTRSFIPAIPFSRLILLSLVNIGAFQALLFVAAQRLPGGIAALVGALQPLLMLALLRVVDQQRPAAIALGAAAGGVLGMILLFARPDLPWDPLGLMAAFLGTGCLAVGSFLSRRWQQGMPSLAFAGWQLTLGGLALVPLSLLTEPALPPLAPRHWLGLGYLSIVGTLVAYPLWINGLSRLPGVAVSALGLLSPVTAVSLGWMFLGQSLGLRELTGVAVVMASVIAIQFSTTATTPPWPPRDTRA